MPQALLYIPPIGLRTAVSFPVCRPLTSPSLIQCALSVSLALYWPLCAQRLRLYTSQMLESSIGINLTPVYRKLRLSPPRPLSMPNLDDLRRKHYCSLQRVVMCLPLCTPRMGH